MNFTIRIIPELNYWMDIILKNSPVYETHHKIPVKMSDEWREPRSVIELLFNETFDAAPLPSSSSSSSSSSLYESNIEDENDKPYIYLYRQVNLLRIKDKQLLNRVQLYRWFANIFTANSLKFLDLFNMQGSILDPNKYKTQEVFMPYDVDEEDRSPFITYENWNSSFTNYPLWKTKGTGPHDFPPDLPIIKDAEIFQFTDLTFDMLDMLYKYRFNCPVDLSVINYNDLDSCLAKLIYIYLDAYLNNNLTFYDNNDIISIENNILCSLYEKHVINSIYLLKDKEYGVIWKDNDIINNKHKEIKEDFFIMLKTKKQYRRYSEVEEETGYFKIDTQLPWNRKDFTFFKDGIILTQDKDYTISLDVNDAYNPFIKVILLRKDFILNEKVRFIWSYAEPHSAYTEDLK